VRPAKLSNEEKAALLDLLDDPSPTVRRALLERFRALGPAARDLLTSTAQGSNRALAWFARDYLEDLNFTDPVADFSDFIASLNYELETGALLLARTVRPDLDVGECCAELDNIAARCRELIVEPATAREKCRVLNRVLYHEWQFRGNFENYTDPDNSFLDQVLARRQGIPISLCVLYLLVGQRLGLDLEPIGLPGHFMVGCFADEVPFFIDAFDGGVFRSPEEVFLFLRAHDLAPKLSDLAPTPVREVLCRSCRNLAHHYEARDERERAQLFARYVVEFEATYTKHTST